MAEGSIQRLLGLLIFTVIIVAIQLFIIKVMVKKSVKRQILLNAFQSILWSLVAVYSLYKEYNNLFFYNHMGFIMFYTLNSYLVVKGEVYDLSKITQKYKYIILLLGFIFYILLVFKRINIYLFMGLIEVFILLIYFSTYKIYMKFYESKIK